MKIEKLTDNKIRIIINTNDIDEFNIEKKYKNLDLLIKDETCASNLISVVLKQVKKTINFSIPNSNLLIEMFSSENDFIVFIITKNTLNTYSSKPYSFGFLYKFDSFDDFLDFCNTLNSITIKNIIPKHLIIYEFETFYYIYLSSFSYKKYRLFCNYLLEFASFVDSNKILNNRVIEYGKVILKNNAFITYIKSINDKH